MSDVETLTYESEYTIRLTPSGKLPSTIPCSMCFADMRRLTLKKRPTYKCKNSTDCGAVTSFDMPAGVKE